MAGPHDPNSDSRAPGFDEENEEPTEIRISAPAMPADFAEDPDEMTSLVSVGERELPGNEKDRHLLVRLRGAAAGEVTRLPPTPCRLGRSADAYVVLNDEGVSRKHAMLIPDEDSYLLMDTESANGTFVAGERITQRVLRDGDIVQFGPKAVFRYTLTDESHEALLRQLFRTSVTDSLTGARKREYFDNRLLSELSFSKRHESPLSLIMVDVDHFKKVNDVYGHTAGDQVLMQLSSLIKKGLREEDVFARYGGEEFAIITPGVGLEGARAVAERLRAKLEALEIRVPEGTLRVTMSCGCATASELEEPLPEALVKLADVRLYAAKHGGRNRVVAKS
ncbi:MAG: GGDEF domain-containing protein [Myxococcota bacterium]|nr:GGDEF domain-containing protein [Myxococcota bacterium]